MQTHAVEGENVINKIMAQTGEDTLFLHNARLFAGYHHEKWDGNGYPRGLSGTDIPLQGRIMAIADVYDALVSERPYKKPLTAEKAENIIMEEAGIHFDPEIANIFNGVKEAFRVAKES
jgi:putative two-component system response regulator